MSLLELVTVDTQPKYLNSLLDYPREMGYHSIYLQSIISTNSLIQYKAASYLTNTHVRIHAVQVKRSAKAIYLINKAGSMSVCPARTQTVQFRSTKFQMDTVHILI